MPSFNLGPYFVKIKYQVGTHPHVMTLPISLKGPFEGVGSMPNVQDEEGNDQDLDTWLDEFADELKKGFASDATFSSWDAFHVASANSIPEWIYSGSFTTATGTNPGTTVIAGELIITFRTALGNRFKLYLMESTEGPNNVTSGAVLATHTAYGGVVGMITRNPFYTVVGRDGARVVAPMRGVSKINDVLRRKYLIA